MKRFGVVSGLGVLLISFLAAASFAGTHQITYFKGNKAGAVSLTFDDGYQSQVTTGLSQLNARGLKGTFFTLTQPGYIDSHVSWATWQMVASQGHEIGSHTVTHPDLTTLDQASMLAELADSQSAIYSNIWGPYISLAYPFGNSNAQVQAAASSYYVAARGTWSPEGGILNHYQAGSDMYGSWQQLNFYNTGAYSTSDAMDPADAYFNTLLDVAVMRHAWATVIFHEITNPTGFGKILDKILTKDVWVDTYGNISRYMKERMSSQLAVVSETFSEIRLQLSHDVRAIQYNVPLTIRSTVPQAWAAVMMRQQDSVVRVLLPVQEEGEAVVYYDATPNRGEIVLSDGTPVNQGGVLYVASNPTIYPDEDEYIAVLDAGTGVTNYFKPTYDAFGRTYGWANPEGMAFVRSRLFVAGSLPSYFGPRGIWEIDPYTAKTLSFVSTPGEPRGVASDGAGLYVTVFSGNTSSIYYCYTFSYLSSKLMDFGHEDIQGLAFGRGYLFASSRSALYRIGISSPMVVGGSRLPWDDVTGLDFVDGPTPFLLATVSSENAVFKLGLNGRLDWDGTYSVFQLLGAGRHKAVALRP